MPLLLLLLLRMLLFLLPVFLFWLVLLLFLLLPVITTAFFRLLLLRRLGLFLSLLRLLFLVMLLLLFLFILLFAFVSSFFQGAEADLAYYISKPQVCFLRFGYHYFNRFELLGFNPLFVQLANLLNPGDSKWVLFVAAVVAVPPEILEDISFFQASHSTSGFDSIGVFREVFQCIQ